MMATWRDSDPLGEFSCRLFVQYVLENSGLEVFLMYILEK
jgi:hypothetical protein